MIMQYIFTFSVQTFFVNICVSVTVAYQQLQSINYSFSREKKT